jgi:hypothetical protein
LFVSNLPLVTLPELVDRTGGIEPGPGRVHRGMLISRPSSNTRLNRYPAVSRRALGLFFISIGAMLDWRIVLSVGRWLYWPNYPVVFKLAWSPGA